MEPTMHQVPESRSELPAAEAPEPRRSRWARARAAEEIDLAEIVRFLRRQWLWIFGLALLFGAATAAVLAAMPRVYETTAMLVAMPSPVTSKLKPEALTIDGYRTLLESEPVVLETEKRLVQAGLLGADEPLVVGDQILSRVFNPRQGTARIPILKVIAHSTDADHATQLANTWVDVFLEHLDRLNTEPTDAAITFVDEQYRQLHRSVDASEDERVEQSSRLKAEESAVAASWIRRAANHKSAAAVAVAAVYAETRRLIEAYRSEQNLKARRAELAALLNIFGNLREEESELAGELAETRLLYEELQRRLTETPRVLKLEKALSDELLLLESTAEKRTTAALVTEEINPHYSRLAGRVDELAAEKNALEPRARQLVDQLAELERIIQEKSAALGEAEAGLERLEREREAELARVEAEQEAALLTIELGRDRELAVHREESDNQIAQLTRDIDVQRELFDSLADNYNEAVIAKAQLRLADVRLAVPPTVPARPEPRRLAVRVLFASVLGGLLGLLVAMTRQQLRAAGPRDDS